MAYDFSTAETAEPAPTTSTETEPEPDVIEVDNVEEAPDAIEEHLHQTAKPGVEAPDFHTILLAVRDTGLVGEEENILTVTVGMIRGKLIILYGVARGGKDAIIEAAMNLYPQDYTYEWPSDESPTAPFYKANDINEYPVQYFGDLASIQEHQEKIMKAFGEGKNADRDVTDISAPEGEETKLQELECPRTNLATIALDNRNVDLNDFPEILKRALMLSVDASKQQTDRVVYRKAQEHADQVEREVDPVRVAEIRQYLGNIPVEKFDDHPNNKIVNPAAIEIAEQKPMPTEFPEARFDFDRLLDFVGTVTLFRHAERMTVDTGRGLKMLTTPTDIWFAMKILGERMVMSSLNLTDEDQAVLRYLRESSSMVDRTDIQQGLRQAGYNINDRDIQRSLTSMREKGYVQVDKSSSPHSFSLSPFASVTEFEVGLDYQKIVDAAAESIYKVSGVPEAVADEYVRRYCEGEGTFVTDPYDGEEIDITEDTSFQDSVNDATDDIADAFDEPVFGSTDDAEESEPEPEPEPETEAKTQGTLE
ncbi:hypothetical protein ACFQL7_20645 [Halocatena marina]|uniref:ATPase n=1 Tax=Halocatena marina TaxID=2934937 RepID=A0ABD5YSS4_9EURY|nr:hypothetical protein [Halocatena marina]